MTDEHLSNLKYNILQLVNNNAYNVFNAKNKVINLTANPSIDIDDITPKPEDILKSAKEYLDFVTN